MTRFPFFPLLPLRGGTLRVKFLLSVENAGLKLGCIINKGRVEGVQRRNIKDRVGWQKEWEERWWVKKNERFADRRPWPTVYVNARLDCNSTQFWRLRLSLLLALSLSFSRVWTKSARLYFLSACSSLSRPPRVSQWFIFTSESLGRLPLSYLILNWSKICASAITTFHVRFDYPSFSIEQNRRIIERMTKKKNSIIKYRNINIFRSYNPFKIF